ncbi:TPA: DUF4062 domain-containing protein [Escherichia coli]|uniref:DUF4062 domain-containing protein n=1 Tax=Escherichia coli TaxID=562 RepID=UPI001F1AFEE9|nr:DUF4062 domain-containing protein [Escherichia coli]MEB6717801.1 DUF4062 domain-containing protein [Escherichia coli]HAV7786538.1 DUF4062 domain-containing protein [Escherichia coli]HBB5164374.1 DUF4062 domain-containing protein [Escherichia coli]
MAYTATVIPVMIASPGDVTEERRIIREVIHEWNDINSALSKVMLIPVGWETHTSPELGMRPQELINQRLLVDCDLLIGAFWTRLGSPTGDEASGTVEEIHKHLDAGKPAMIYFSSKPVVLDTVDMGQYDALKAFKQECMQQGLIETFNESTDFKHKLYKQLTLTLTNNSYLKNIIKSYRSEGTDNLKQESPKMLLSEDAIFVLKMACEDESGGILILEHLDGTDIHVGGQSLGGGNAREVAKWKSALDELKSNELISSRDYKGVQFEVTHKGWTLFESLKNK